MKCLAKCLGLYKAPVNVSCCYCIILTPTQPPPSTVPTTDGPQINDGSTTFFFSQWCESYTYSIETVLQILNVALFPGQRDAAGSSRDARQREQRAPGTRVDYRY